MVDLFGQSRRTGIIHYVQASCLALLLVLVLCGCSQRRFFEASTPIIGIDRTSLTFTAVSGANVPPAQPVIITNRGIGTLTFTIKNHKKWLVVYFGGTAPDTVEVFAYSDDLSVGVYYDTLFIISDADNISQRIIPVRFTVLPGFLVTPTSVSRAAYTLGPRPAPETLSVVSQGGGDRVYAMAPPPSWLDVGYPAGLATDHVVLNFISEILPTGVYEHNLTLATNDAVNTPAIVACSLFVNPWNARMTNNNLGFRSIRFASRKVGWASGLTKYVNEIYAALYVTQDSGLTWTDMKAPKSASYTGMTLVGENTLWFTDENGQAVVSRDGGATFTAHETGSDYVLQDVFFISPDTGWVVGGGGFVARTTDGGETWTPQPTPTTVTLYSVAFADNMTGWAVGSSGTILATADGGATWSGGTGDNGRTLRYIRILSNESAWIVGNGGLILFHPYASTKWIAMPSGTTDDLIEVSFLNPQIGWVVGRSGTILHTADGGLTWHRQASGTSRAVYSVFPLDSNRVFVAGDNGMVMDTYSGGE